MKITLSSAPVDIWGKNFYQFYHSYFSRLRVKAAPRRRLLTPPAGHRVCPLSRGKASFRDAGKEEREREREWGMNVYRDGQKDCPRLREPVSLQKEPRRRITQPRDRLFYPRCRMGLLAHLRTLFASVLSLLGGPDYAFGPHRERGERERGFCL